MESKIDEILKQLHQFLFADSVQIIVELKHYLHDYTHSEGDLAFISSKIFNSSESLLEFLRKNVSENDKLIAGIKKRIYELIIHYSLDRPQQLSTYLPQIKETCLRSFMGDSNSLVKESSLQLLHRIIDYYPLDSVKKIVRPPELINRLLDEIKLRRPSASVKGTIWNLVGLLHKRFPKELKEYLVESQDQMYRELKDQMKSQKPEFRTIIGIIKGMSFSLEDDCTLDKDEVEGLFVLVKTGMQPIADVRQKGVQKAAMKLFITHVQLFKKIIPEHAENMVKLTLKLCVDTDINVRDAANDMLGKLMKLISDGLTVDETIHKDIFNQIIDQFQQILEDPNNNIQLISAIKAIGVFSKAIKIFMSEEMLLKYLERLIELSEFKLIKEFEDQKNPDEDVQNFKYILKKQKQLISYIESYSFILMELTKAPSEMIQTHFFKVCSIGVSNHRKLFDKYKHKFYEALASLVMSLSLHRQQFLTWIRKFVRQTLQETLKIPDAAIFGGESLEESLKDAIQFWREWLNKHDLWSNFTCRIVYDELIFTIVEDIKDLNLSYRIQNQSKEGEEEEDDVQMGIISYISNNNNHQQYLKRLADFLEVFVPECHDEWLLKWVPQISEVLIRKSLETPRIPRIYQILMTCMQICNKYKYFDILNQENEDGEKVNVFNRLLSYFKDLIGKSEEYQDELLLSCIDLLLQVPLALLYKEETGTDNVELWKGIMIKALDLGHLDNRIAMTCIRMLEEWFNTLPPTSTFKLYEEILPKLSDYLNIDQQDQESSGQFYHQKVLDHETEFGRPKYSVKEIANKVLDLLGKIGGYAHNIINNELSKKHDKENFIRWDPEKRLKFTLPLYNKKIDIYLDSCLPRIVDLAQNSNKKEIRIASCEFLHSLIIFMIGKNAQKPQAKKKRGAIQEHQEELAAFAKLYAKLFPVMIKLATDIEVISRQLFEPLCYQIVRWFSSSKIEHPEVESLLDSLIEGAQNKNNNSLRQLCSNAVAEFAKWSLKQMTDQEIETNPVNIKSLIRRIESNSNHPDPFKRLSSVLCFNKIFSVIREFDPLVDRFCLEICYSVLSSLKMCYDKMELSHEVIETSIKLLPKIEKVILRKSNMLQLKNEQRGIVPDLQTFLTFTFEKFKSHETIYRQESVKLWENLIKKCPPSNYLKSNDLKKWIIDKYCVHRREKSILQQIQEIDFCREKLKNSKSDSKTLRKSKLIEQQKNFDLLSAQLEFMHWLLTKGQFSLSELLKLNFKSSVIAKNINSFMTSVVQKTFLKNKEIICQKVMVSKEDRELLTRSQINVMIHVFELMNYQIENVQNDSSLQKWVAECFKGLEQGMTNQEQVTKQNFMIKLALYVILVPQVLKLQLLVENKELESRLRSKAIYFVESYKNQMVTQNQLNDILESNGFIKSIIENKITKEMGILDLKNISGEKQSIYSPRLMLNICLGYLKLSEIDPTLKEYLLQITSKVSINFKKKVKSSKLKTVIEEWLESDSPYENESARILVKFLTKIQISNQVLLEWITQKTSVYLKCSDLLLSYIQEKWVEPQGEYQENEPEEEEMDIDQAKEEVQIVSSSQIQNLSQFMANSQSQSQQLKQPQVEDEEQVQYSCLGEFMVGKIPKNQSILYQIFINLIQQLEDSNILIKYIPQYCTQEIKHEFKDVAINQIKIFGMIAVKSKHILNDARNIEAQTFIQYLIKNVQSYLKERFSVYVKKEVFNLISIISDFPVSSNMEYGKREIVYDRLEPSLNYVKKMHFPMRSRELQINSNEAKNFLIIIEAFLNMAIITKNLKIVRNLYTVIREFKTTFEQTLKNCLNIIVTQHINVMDKQQFLSTVQGFIDEFLNRNLDHSIDDNIRWSIARKIILRILETCSQEYLEALMIQNHKAFIKSLIENNFEQYHDNSLDFFNLVREKTHILIFYEVMFRRLPTKVIKEGVHKKIYGEDSSQNELTKILIEFSLVGKREPIKGFSNVCIDPSYRDGLKIAGNIDTEFPKQNSQHAVQLAYSQAAYSLLSSVIVCTQTKQEPYSKFLFHPKQGTSEFSLWQLIIDQSEDFKFEIQTNFNHVELRCIEEKLAEHAPVDFAGQRIEKMMNEYLTSSFMNTNDKFNQDMVFETQIDKINMKSEEEAFQKLYEKKYHPLSKSQEENKDSQKEKEDQFELDHVNKHTCMKNIKRCIAKMQNLFGHEWKEEMPKFMQHLLDEFQEPDNHINIKIFILKIVSNNPKLFKPYAKYWFEPVCEYITLKNNGGKGFHYFLRDLCTMLTSWRYMPPETSQVKLLLTKVVNQLIWISADSMKLIFKQNIKIISSLIEMWKHYIVIDKQIITAQISCPDQKPDSHLWKMNAIEILALAVFHKIPVVFKVDEVKNLTQTGHEFKIGQVVNGRVDTLLLAILKTFESKKKQIIYACSELVGMILNSQKDKPYFGEIIKQTKIAIFSNEVRERHDVFVYAVERVSREYDHLLVDRDFFLKTSGFINILTGSMRAAVFKTFERYIKIAKKMENIKDIDDMAMSIFAESKNILADINDDNQQAILSLLVTFSELKGIDSVEKMIDSFVSQLKHLFIRNKNEYSRGRFYDLMVNLYDRYENYKENIIVKGSLIYGLKDQSKMIRDKLVMFWNDRNRLELDPCQRLQQLMQIMYVNDEENIWLTNAVFLLLNVSSESSDFDRKIFEEPLQECQFAPLYMNMSSNNQIINRSQPMTPLFTQVDQMIQSSQNNQQIAKNSLHDASQGSNDQIVQEKSPIKGRRRDQEQMHQGFVRATQLPQFTQTQANQSMLIAGLKSGPQATLSDSFYGMGNRANDKSPVKSPPMVQQAGGTTLFTINEDEEDKVSNHAGEPSQDSDGFIAPMPKKKGYNAKFKKFFNANEYQHRPMEVTQGQKIRFMHEATMPSHLARQEEIRRMQRQKFIEKQMNQRKNQVSLYRQYRIGELPDIQIDFKDVIMPLMAIVRADQTIATEVFVEIFKEVYQDEKDQEIRDKLGGGLKNILSTSKLYDYSTMNCAHRIAMELLKIDGFTVDSAVIERTGQHSMSFQTSLILLEESIIRGKLDSEDSQQNKKIKYNNSQITNQNKQYWFKLIKLYEIIGDQDALHGIWCQLAQKDGIMFKQLKEQQEDFEQMLSQGQNIDSNIELKMENEYDQREVVNLIKYAQDLKNKGKIDQALKQMESTLSNPQLCRDFDESIKHELENKSLQYKSELLKWDQIASGLLLINENKTIQEINDIKIVDMMIRSQIRSEHHWHTLTSQINNWMIDDYSKCILEKNFCYELAMFFLTSSDYDRARIFIDKESTELLSQWKNLTKLSQVAQHFLVQRIQKIYEMKEFLGLVQDFNQKADYDIDEQIKQVIKSMINWKQRSPSNSFDPINVWDDISQSRKFFIDHYCIKYESTFLHKAIMESQIDKTQSQKTQDDLLQIKDIQVMMHIQTAKGAFKMGAYDSSDRYLKQFQTKQSSSTANDMRIIVPIIKLKTEQCKSELRNLNFQEKMAKVDKIYRVLSNKMDQNKYDFNDLENLIHCQNLENIKTVVKSNMLKFILQKKLLSIILTESQNDKSCAQYVKNTNYYLSESFKCLENTQLYLKQYVQGESQNQQIQAYKVHQQGKLQFRFAKFADKLLRKMQKDSNKEGSAGPQQLLKKCLNQVKKDEQALAKMVIQSGLQSLNMGYFRASDIIPRILDVLGGYRESVQDEFMESSKNTPSWLFLRWISQIAAILNRPESTLMTTLVMEIAQKYPQALYYPFQVIKSNLEINFLDQNQGQSQLIQLLHHKFRQYLMLNQWSEALDCMIFPEHRFKYWFQIVCDTYQDPSMAIYVQNAAQGHHQQNDPLVLKIRRIILQMYNDIMVREKPLVGKEIGQYNLQFINKWETTFAQRFGINGSKISQMNLTQLVTEIQNINKKVNEVQLFQGNELVSKYSEWLDKFDCNEFYQAKNYIEIPGQYENTLEPLSSKNVKIANVKKVCLVLGSIRRPKKITIHGSNEKDYHLLIKGGEDLRLDQRVQQIFSIINGIFKEDPSCENRDLNIKTFKVVPISNRLGSFEWVDNTEPMKALISKEHKRLYNGNDLNKSRAYNQRLNWLQKISEKDGQKNAHVAQMHISVLKLEEDEVVQAFNNHQAAMPFYLLRNALENLCLTSSAFLTIKNQFIKSMAVFSITSYLIGIGDRHLENFLIDTTDGEVFGIDFGIAFGSGVHLSIPELMPFRLTQQIEGVIAPHPLEGIYKQTMVHAMNAMRKKKSLILDSCEIFVKEPLLDWIKDAVQKNRGSAESTTMGNQSMTQDGDSVLSWYPRQKIEIVKNKLLGINPVKILSKELKDSVHERKREYITEVKKAIQGSEDSIRYHHLANSKHRKFLDVEDQVDILIELARDPNILGRTWIGWSPYI